MLRIKAGEETVRRIIYIAFSIAVTVGIFSYLLTRVSLRDVLQLIRGADHRGIMMFLVLSFSMSLFRLWRYQVLLRLSGHAPGSAALFLVVLVRNFFSDLLPARIGSLIYIYLVNSRLAVPFSAAAASFSLAFVFDLIAIAPMILIAVLGAGLGAKLSPAALLGGSLFLGAVTVAVLYALPWLFRTAGRIAGKAAFLRSRTRERFAAALASVAGEIQVAQKAGVYGRILALSVLVRLSKYAALYVFLFALLAPLGYGFAQLHALRVFLGICASELAASLPISGIAGFGIYEGTWSLVFALLGFPQNIANLTSISHHLFTQVYGYSLGAAALVALLLPVFKTADSRSVQPAARESGLLFYSKVTVTILATMALLWGCLRVPSGSAARTERRADIPSREEIAAREALGTALPNRILFDSDRSGTFGIYSMKTDGSDVRAVVDTPSHEMYPDLSPDGKWIVFAQTPSLAKYAPAEIHICRRDGSEERTLADDATFPTFSRDGKTVFFERGRKKVMAVNVDGTREREVFPGANREFDAYQIVKPRVSPDGRHVAFISDRKGAWNSWFADVETQQAFHVHSGCEASWFSDGRRLVWVNQDDSVKERTGLFQFDIVTRQITALQDAGAPRGHEYFPCITADDRFLLWGACREREHSHTDSNYQLFAKNLTGGESVRLMFDGFDNRWPKWMPPEKAEAAQ